jgi:hypothetical protein
MEQEKCRIGGTDSRLGTVTSPYSLLQLHDLFVYVYVSMYVREANWQKNRLEEA